MPETNENTRIERWVVDYEHEEGQPQHAVLSWVTPDDPTTKLPEVGEYLVRERDAARLLKTTRNARDREIERLRAERNQLRERANTHRKAVVAAEAQVKELREALRQTMAERPEAQVKKEDGVTPVDHEKLRREHPLNSHGRPSFTHDELTKLSSMHNPDWVGNLHEAFALADHRFAEREGRGALIHLPSHHHPCPLCRALAMEGDIGRLKAKIGEADALLGRARAGGSAAGTVPAIHNLIHRTEEAEAQVKELRESLCFYTQGNIVIVREDEGSIAREALASSEPKENTNETK